jgi:hypothetical protein
VINWFNFGILTVSSYEERLFTFALGQDKDFVYCANDKCKNGQSVIIDKNDPRMQCSACKKSTCTKCQVLWHEDQTCAEVQAVQIAKQDKMDPDTAKLLAKTTKSCLNCGWRIEKNEGCTSITC